MKTLNKFQKIEAVDVYLEKRKSREYVGQLSRGKSTYIFQYADIYLFNKNAIPLGPDLPLTQKKFTSSILFPSFEDRIPSRKNPAYTEYCEMVGIDPSEKNSLTLVATLGKKGPSSFIFSPAPIIKISSDDIIKFRKDLDLTIREFSDLFDFSPSTINRIENKIISGKDALKRLEIYYYFPEVAFYEVTKNLPKIHEKKQRYITEYFITRLQDGRSNKKPL